jgi:tRNA-dihydrouridine synthase B
MIAFLQGTPLFLAPLAGLTDRPFRILCRRGGADIVVSEMVSADGLLHDSAHTFEYLRFEEEERPFGIQLFGSDPTIMAKAAEIVAKEKPDFIDVNMGCPVRKVVKRNAGSALLQNPKLAAEIVQTMKGALSGTGIPLSVKIRSGWDAWTINAVEVAKALEGAGADFLTVHPRTRVQMYSGQSDWSIIAAIRESVTIPVIGNGDVHTADDARRMLEQTGCQAVMIGRGAVGRPWLFGEIRHFFLTGEELSPSLPDKRDWIRLHIDLVRHFNDERRAAIELRVHLCAYTKGIPGGAAIRETIQRTTDLDVISDIMQRLYHG